jgi:hypothetical protein
MVRLLVKLVLVAVLASAGWRLGSDYMTHYRFREAVRQLTLDRRTEAGLRQAILETAAHHGIPQADEDLAIDLEERRTTVSGVYVRSIELLPGLERPWTFEWTLETFSAPAMRTTP